MQQILAGEEPIPSDANAKMMIEQWIAQELDRTLNPYGTVHRDRTEIPHRLSGALENTVGIGVTERVEAALAAKVANRKGVN